MNVLLVHQDDPETTNNTRGLLKERGHSPRCLAARSLSGKAGDIPPADVVIVFSEIYRENETYAVCRRVRETESFRDTPLLVAVNMYQMPLANRVKAMPNSHFIFTPVNATDLEERLRMFTGPGAADEGEKPPETGNEPREK